MANFSTENKGTWFYFDENDEKNGGVCIRVLSPTESAKIEKLTIKKKNKFKAGSHFVETITDDEMNTRLMWDYIITEWKNVCVNGKEVECNSKNKIDLLEDPSFANFVIKSMNDLQDNIENGSTLEKN